MACRAHLYLWTKCAMFCEKLITEMVKCWESVHKSRLQRPFPHRETGYTETRRQGHRERAGTLWHCGKRLDYRSEQFPRERFSQRDEHLPSLLGPLFYPCFILATLRSRLAREPGKWNSLTTKVSERKAKTWWAPVPISEETVKAMGG